MKVYNDTNVQKNEFWQGGGLPAFSPGTFVCQFACLFPARLVFHPSKRRGEGRDSERGSD